MGRFGASSRLGFKDGLQMLVEHRQGDSPEISSTFLHVLEPHTDDQSPALHDMKARASAGDASMGAVAQLTTREGVDVIVASSLAGGSIEDEAIRTDARIAMATPEMATLTLFDGSRLEVDGAEITMAPSWNMALERVIGDLSGQPQESALVVRSQQPLPVGDLLAGQTVNVEHQTSKAHVSAYEIETVSLLADGLYRIDLKHIPPFIRRKVLVTGIRDIMSRGKPTGDKQIFHTHRLHDGVGRPHALGRRLMFPRTGFRSTIRSQQPEGYAGWWSRRLVPNERPKTDDVRVGDPVIIYTIAAGDRVIIPSLFTCRPTAATKQTITCDIFSTSAAQLTLLDNTVTVSQGKQQLQLKVVAQQNADGIRVALSTARMTATNAINATPEPEAIPEIAAHYSFDADPKGYVKDDSGQQAAKAWIKDGGSETYVDGVQGKAIRLDGGAFISVGQHGLALGANKAISFWVRLDDPIGGKGHPYAPGIFAGGPRVFDNFLSFAQDKKGGHLLMLEGTKGKATYFSIPTVAPGTWRHFALSADKDGRVTCYSKGKSVGTQATQAGADFRLNVGVIGRGYAGKQGALTGALDEILFYNHVLTTEDVANLAIALPSSPALRE